VALRNHGYWMRRSLIQPCPAARPPRSFNWGLHDICPSMYEEDILCSISLPGPHERAHNAPTPSGLALIHSGCLMGPQAMRSTRYSGGRCLAPHSPPFLCCPPPPPRTRYRRGCRYAPVTRAQYTANMEGLYLKMRGALAPGGSLVWSTTTVGAWVSSAFCRRGCDQIYLR